jgi:ribose 5-phosphate isomerase A
MKTASRLHPLAEAALEMIRGSSVIGLGSGRAATAFVEALGERVREGLPVLGVPTSHATADLASHLGIPLAGLDDIESIDITVDGADEVDPELNLIKGLGGALVRERIVASCSRRLVILVGSEKLVPTLGDHGVLPVEVVPFAAGPCRRRLIQLGYPPVPRQVLGQPFLTDNGNYVFDCQIQPLADPIGLEQTLRSIPGIVGTGLFLGMAPTVLVENGGPIEVHSPR